MTPPVRLFCYGTLRTDIQRGRSPSVLAYRVMKSGAVSEGMAWITGHLYALSWYPAFVDSGVDRVRGEVWRITRPEVMRLLNGFDEGEFDRQLHRATLDDGRRVTAWTYAYRLPVRGVPRIASGDYLEWLRSTQSAQEAAPQQIPPKEHPASEHPVSRP